MNRHRSLIILMLTIPILYPMDESNQKDNKRTLEQELVAYIKQKELNQLIGQAPGPIKALILAQTILTLSAKGRFSAVKKKIINALCIAHYGDHSSQNLTKSNTISSEHQIIRDAAKACWHLMLNHSHNQPIITSLNSRPSNILGYSIQPEKFSRFDQCLLKPEKTREELIDMLEEYANPHLSQHRITNLIRAKQFERICLLLDYGATPSDLLFWDLINSSWNISSDEVDERMKCIKKLIEMGNFDLDRAANLPECNQCSFRSAINRSFMIPITIRTFLLNQENKKGSE